MNSPDPNPYAAPKEPLAKPEVIPQQRSQELEQLAQRRIRIGVIALLPGALLNCLAAPLSRVLAGREVPTSNPWFVFEMTVIIAGMVLLVAAALFLWWRGAALFMLVSVLLKPIFGRGTDRDGWINATLEGTRGFVPGMTVGAAVWLTYDFLVLGGPWSFEFYFLFGTLAHVCGAIAYVPILVQWYRYRRECRETASLVN